MNSSHPEPDWYKNPFAVLERGRRLILIARLVEILKARAIDLTFYETTHPAGYDGLCICDECCGLFFFRPD